MKQLTILYLPWLLSAITLWMTYLQGEKNTLSWVVGLVGQLGWFILTFVTGLYGLLPLNIGLTVLYYRNYVKWKRDTGGVK